MNSLEFAKKQLNKAAIHFERVYPTDQLRKGIEDLQAMFGLDIDLPPMAVPVDEYVDFEEEVSRLIGMFREAETRLQMAETRLRLFRKRLDGVEA